MEHVGPFLLDMFLQFLPCKAWRPWLFILFGSSSMLEYFRSINDIVGCDEDGMCQDKKTVTVQSHYFTTANKNLGVVMMRREAWPMHWQTCWNTSANYSIWWIWTSAIGNRIWFQIRESPTSSRMVTWSSLHLYFFMRLPHATFSEHIKTSMLPTKETWVMCSLATNWCEDAQYRSCGKRAHNMREDSRFSRLMMVAMMYMRK